MYNLKNFGDNESPIWLTTAIINVNGKDKEVIPAFHSKNRAPSSSAKDIELIKQVDSSKLLDCRFNFCNADIFFNAGVELYDIQEKPIPKELPEGTPRVVVYLDDAVSYWQFGVRRVIPATILSFESVKEALQAVGTTDLFSRALNNVEVIGLAAAVSGNSIYDDVWKFSNTYKMPANTAMLYLKVRNINRRVSKIVAAGIHVDEAPVQERSYKDAVILYEAMIKASHDVKLAKSRYYISVINSFNDTYSLDEILGVLENISYDEGEQMRLASCNDKEFCIREVLKVHFVKLRESDSKPKEVA